MQHLALGGGVDQWGLARAAACRGCKGKINARCSGRRMMSCLASAVWEVRLW